MMDHGYAQTSVGALHYQRAGRGPALVLLPQSGRSISMFRALVQDLARDFHVVAIDLPGSGGSCGYPEGLAYEDVADAVAELLGHLELKQVFLYGIHTGNKIATAVAARWPGRVQRLVIAGQSHSIIPDQGMRNAAVRSHMPALDVSTSDATRAMRAWLATYRTLTDLWCNDATVRAIPDRNARNAAIDKVTDLLRTREDKPHVYQANFAYDLGSDMRRVRCPTLVVEITTDLETRDHGTQAAAIRDAIPTARIEALHEPDGFALTLENRSTELAALMREFLIPPH